MIAYIYITRAVIDFRDDSNDHPKVRAPINMLPGYLRSSLDPRVPPHGEWWVTTWT